jgi:hypothetical protein
LESEVYIPDPDELGEMRAEAYDFENRVGDKIRCVECRELRPEGEMLPSSADPYSPPICSECVEKIAPDWMKK